MGNNKKQTIDERFSRLLMHLNGGLLPSQVSASNIPIYAEMIYGSDSINRRKKIGASLRRMGIKTGR